MTIIQDSDAALCQGDFMRRLRVVLDTTARAWAQGSDLPKAQSLDKQTAPQKARRLGQRTRFYSFGQYAHQP